MDEFHTRKIGNAGLSHQAMFLAFTLSNEEDTVIDTHNVSEELENTSKKRKLSEAEVELRSVCRRALAQDIEVLVVCH